MSYIGKIPANAVLTTADLADGIVTAAKIEDGTVVAAEIASNAVTTAKINADAVTGAKIADDAINSEHYTDGSIDTAHIADAQITAAKLASGVGEITEADMFRITTGYNGYNDPITANWERADTDNFAVLGSGLSQSSGIFTFPSTGYYFITFQASFTRNGDDRGINAAINVTTNNSSYSDISSTATFVQQTESDATSTFAKCSAIVHCDNTSNVKVSFTAGGAGTTTNGGTSAQATGFSVFKLAGT
jgi:hypothetical protein